MTVTRYKRSAVTEEIHKAVLGVMRHKAAEPAVVADEADQAKQAAPASARKARTADDLTENHAAVVAPMRISPTLRARARRMKRDGGRNDGEAPPLLEPFKPYQPAPGVLPDGQKADMAMDSALQTWAQDSYATSYGAINPFGSAFAEGVAFLGYAYLSELTQRPEYRRMGERIGTETTRKWIRLTISGEADPEDENDEDAELASDKAPEKGKKKKPKKAKPAPSLEDEDDEDDEPVVDPAQKKRNEALLKKLREIEDDFNRLDVRGKFRKVAEYDSYMGRSHLFIDTGEDAGGDIKELLTDIGNGSDDISKKKFKKGSLRALKHIEPIWCYPVSYNANNPLSDDWYNPQVWFVMQKQVHCSRLLTFVGREVPDILKPAYAFGGLSLSQMAKPYVDNWLRTRQAVTQLIESFSVSGVYTNAQSMLQGGGEEVLDRIELFNLGRTNSGTMVLDKEQEEFFNISTPLGTLDHLQAQSQEQLSSVSGIPLIVLLGITPSGLNASSEGELRCFYDLIHAFQEHFFRDKLKRVLDFVQLNLFGEVDPAIGFEFEPLWSLDEKGEAEVRKIKAETHQVYVDMGVIGQDEIRQVEIDDDDSPYNGLEPDDLPEPPDQLGMVDGSGGAGGEGGSSSSDNREVKGAADSALTLDGAVLELGDDVFAFDEGQFEEGKHPRDNSGKFATTAGSGAPGSEHPSFKSKKEHIAHLLTNGTTPKEIMQTMGWPSVSMPAQAKSLGMKLQVETIDGKKVYKGVPMTDAEKAEVKAQAKKKPEVAEQVASQIQPAELDTAKAGATWAAIALAQEEAGNHNAAEKAWGHAEALGVKKPPKAAPPAPAKSPEAVKPKATPEELKKAKKSTPLPLLTSDPDGAAAVKAFNDKYQGKDNLSTEQLDQKVQDHKDLMALVKQKETDAQAAAAKNAKEKSEAAKKLADEKVAKEKADLEAKFAADPELKMHHEAMEALFGGKDAGAQFAAMVKSKVKSSGLNIRPEEALPIVAYSGSHYGKVNSELRAGTMTVAQYKFMKSLNAGLDKLPAYTKPTYRRASLSPSAFAAYVPGHIVEERGFTSTSKNEGTWSGSHTYTVHGKTGRDIQKLSSHSGEAEVLFKSGTRFLVKSVKGTHIELEEV